MITAVGIFIAAGIVLIAAATALTKAGDALAGRTGIGRVWIGSVLLAGATSLPELLVDISAVRMSANDIAAGDLFGSSMANMLILAVVDLLPPSRRVLRGAALDHVLAACCAIVLNAAAAAFVLLRPRHHIFGISPESMLLLVVYLAGMRVVYRHSVRPGGHPSADMVPGAASLGRAVAQFGIAALAILAVAPFFAKAAKDIAELSGLGGTFVGTFLVGLSTSAPELVSCLAAVRMGAFDLAVGNLFGSNAFNMVVFVAIDVAAPEPIFAALDPTHALSALFAIVLMALGVAAIVYRAERRWWMIEPDSLLMVGVYLLAVWLVYTHAAGGRPVTPVPAVPAGQSSIMGSHGVPRPSSRTS